MQWVVLVLHNKTGLLSVVHFECSEAVQHAKGQHLMSLGCNYYCQFLGPMFHAVLWGLLEYFQGVEVALVSSHKHSCSAQVN